MKINHNPLVFIPGWSFKATVFSDLAGQLSHNHLLLDLPNPERESHDPYVQLDALANQLEKQIPLNATIVAWSFGGLLAMYFCHRFPLRCSKLILIASTPRFLEAPDWPGISITIANRFKLHAKRNLHDLIKYFLRLIEYPYHQAMKHHIIDNCRYKLLHMLDLVFRCDLRDIYSMLDLPILNIIGNNDAIISPNNITNCKFQKNIAAHHIVPGAGHAAFNTHQEIMINIMNEFLNHEI